MSRTKRESTVLPFQCSLVNRQVQIFRDYTILLGGSGEEVARAIAKTSCGDMDKCAVATHHGMSTTYDWSKCAFVKTQPAQ